MRAYTVIYTIISIGFLTGAIFTHDDMITMILCAGIAANSIFIVYLNETIRQMIHN